MPHTSPRIAAVFFLFMTMCLCAGAAKTSAESIAGDIATFDAPGERSGWWNAGEKVVVDGRSVMRLAQQSKGKAIAYRRVSIGNWDTKQVTLTLTSRVTDLRDADPPRNTAKVLVRFEDANRKVLAFKVLHPETDGRWHTVSETFEVPTGAASVRLEPGMWNAAGVFDVDVISLTLGTEAPDHSKVGWQPPPDTDWFDVTAQPYEADPTGQTDSTQALQRAFADARARFETTKSARGVRPITVYFPAGTYVVSDTLSFGEGKPQHLHVVGAGEDKATLRLAPNAPGFQGDDARPVIDYLAGTGHRFFSSNVSFNNVVRDITIEVGAGNPAAAGLGYHNNNIGYVKNVTIRSLDPDHRGHTGLWLAGWLGGISYLSHITIEGFDTGVYAKDRKILYVLEDITLRNQRVAGIVSDRKPLTIRKLISDNTVPAVINENDTGQIVLLDSTLRGGAEDAAAIENRGLLFVRNVDIVGYGSAIHDRGESVTSDHVDEYVSGEVLTLGRDTPARSLNLPIRDTPQIPIEPRDQWTVVDGEAQDDDTAAIQAAIDSGATTVHLRGVLHISDTIVLRGNVRHLTGDFPGGIGSTDRGLHPMNDEVGVSRPMLRIETGDHDVTLIENLTAAKNDWLYDNASDKTVVIRNAACGPYRNSGRGDVFFEGVAGGVGTGARHQIHLPFIVITEQNAWFRHVNPEGAFPHLVNDGGRVVVLGGKYGERHGPFVKTYNGGETEILGSLFNTISEYYAPLRSWVVNDNSRMSVVAVDDQQIDETAHGLAVRQFQNGNELRIAYADASPRGEQMALALYRGDAGRDAMGPRAWVEPGDDWTIDADGVAELVVRLAEPVERDLDVHLALGANSEVTADALVASPSTVHIPAGQTHATVQIRAAQPRRNHQAAFVVTGGAGYRVDPLKPDALVALLGADDQPQRGLQLHLAVEDSRIVEASGAHQWVLTPSNVQVAGGERPAVVFHKGGQVLLRVAGAQGYHGFLQEAFLERSVAMWVKANGDAGTLFSEGGGYGGFFVKLTDGKLQLTSVAGYHPATIATAWPDDNRWHHVTAVYHRGLQQLYLDGRRVAEGAMQAFVIPVHSATAGLGRDGFKGMVADLRIYDRSLTPNEVDSLAQ